MAGDDVTGGFGRIPRFGRMTHSGDKEQHWSWRLPEDAHPQGLSTFAKDEHLRAEAIDLTDAALAVFADEIESIDGRPV